MEANAALEARRTLWAATALPCAEQFLCPLDRARDADDQVSSPETFGWS